MGFVPEISKEEEEILTHLDQGFVKSGGLSVLHKASLAAEKIFSPEKRPKEDTLEKSKLSRESFSIKNNLKLERSLFDSIDDKLNGSNDET